jgi:D-tyrosyl-tRNA(Tyr) deacylase
VVAQRAAVISARAALCFTARSSASPVDPRGRAKGHVLSRRGAWNTSRSCGEVGSRAKIAQVRAVVQRVSGARVLVDGAIVGEVGAGLCVFLGVARSDDEASAERLAGKIARLRVFENEDGKFDRSVVDVHGGALVVSQFTLIADTAKGNRPSFADAAPPEQAERLYEGFCEALGAHGIDVARGRFGARMVVELANDGPVTIVLDG